MSVRVLPPALALALALAPALAGCLSPSTRVVTPEGGFPADLDRGADEYWMVWVHGNETKDRGPFDARAMCSIVFDHEVDPETKALRLGERYADWSGVQVVVAFDHFDDGDCPLAYEAHLDETRIVQEMGAAGRLTVEVHVNGTARIDGATWVEAGRRVSVGYEASETRGEYVVEALGAWPRSGISR